MTLAVTIGPRIKWNDGYSKSTRENDSRERVCVCVWVCVFWGEWERICVWIFVHMWSWVSLLSEKKREKRVGGCGVNMYMCVQQQNGWIYVCVYVCVCVCMCVCMFVFYKLNYVFQTFKTVSWSFALKNIASYFISEIVSRCTLIQLKRYLTTNPLNFLCKILNCQFFHLLEAWVVILLIVLNLKEYMSNTQ